MSPEERFQRAALTRDLFPTFTPFCEAAMQFLGFKMTWMQVDIAEYMADRSIRFGMVSAQRGEAKSTIACIYGLYDIVENPATRVMVLSGAQEKADENGLLMWRLISQWDLLQYLTPDKYAGDRTSAHAFDVHWMLRGVADKSPSVRCLGLTGSLQGYRADLLIPDDIETQKNSMTATQRQNTELLTKEFTSICTNGRILYLGTPQTADSIYNNLPSRGYNVRIWPGRFPTADELKRYGDKVAPSILERMQILGPKCQTGGGLDGNRGWPTDPERYDESQLQDKELDQGPATFQLQFMLDTAMMDAERRKLNLRDLMIANYTPEAVPERVYWAAEPQHRIFNHPDFAVRTAELYRPAGASAEFTKVKNITMFLDPASDGGDELAYAIGGTVGPYIHVLLWGGLLGGLANDNLEVLAKLCEGNAVSVLHVEKNMGAGTVTKLIQNFFHGIPEIGAPARLPGIGIEESNSTGQKEKRIIDTLRPVIQRHKLVMHNEAVQHDIETCSKYPLDKRALYSGFYQMHNITIEGGSLTKDDRLDALEGLVRVLSDHLTKDELVESQKRREEAVKEFLNNPMAREDFSTARARRIPGALKRRGKR